jgi:hypothetical protein
MPDLTVVGEEFAQTHLLWTLQAWELTLDTPERYVIATVGRYDRVNRETPWLAQVSVMNWAAWAEGALPERSESWHETATAAKAHVQQFVEERPA